MITPPQPLTYIKAKERELVYSVWGYLERYLTPMYKSDPGFSKRKLLKFINMNWNTEIVAHVKSRMLKGGLNRKLFIENNKLKIKLLVPNFREIL